MFFKLAHFPTNHAIYIAILQNKTGVFFMKKLAFITPLLLPFLFASSSALAQRTAVEVCISVPCDMPNTSCLPECRWVPVANSSSTAGRVSSLPARSRNLRDRRASNTRFTSVR